MDSENFVSIVFMDGTEQNIALDTIRSIEYKRVTQSEMEIMSEPVNLDLPETIVPTVEEAEAIPIPLAPTEVPEPVPLGLAKEEPVFVVLTARDVLQDESLRKAFAEASKEKEEVVPESTEACPLPEKEEAPAPAEVQNSEVVADNSVLKHIVETVVPESKAPSVEEKVEKETEPVSTEFIQV